MTESASWRVLWWNRHDADPEGAFVQTAAIGIIGGADPQVVVSEQYHSRHLGIFKCDNTDLYRLADGEHATWWSMFKYPIRTPRMDVAELDGRPITVVNTGHGVDVRRSDAEVDDLGAREDAAEDLITGTFDGRLVAVAAWDCFEDDQPALVQAFDLTGAGGPPSPVTPAWRLPAYNDEAWEWDYPFQWRLGRVGGRPVAGYIDELGLDLRCAVTGDPDAEPSRNFYLDEFGACDCPARIGQCPRLLTVDDRAGDDLALVARHNNDVGCYDVHTGQLRGPVLTGHEGELLGARLGRIRDRPVAVLLLDHGVSLYDIDQARWLAHLDLGARPLDLAFGPDGRLAIATGSGALVGQLTP
ncbi:MAG TPA: hypothetical protein VFI65_04745 [Streptosporangiaceae bacterium]|nr:hypothetical protein [Streptosporangiaceae bacterium]